jgi:hypothetical protein
MVLFFLTFFSFSAIAKLFWNASQLATEAAHPMIIIGTTVAAEGAAGIYDIMI